MFPWQAPPARRWWAVRVVRQELERERPEGRGERESVSKKSRVSGRVSGIGNDQPAAVRHDHTLPHGTTRAPTGRPLPLSVMPRMRTRIGFIAEWHLGKGAHEPRMGAPEI